MSWHSSFVPSMLLALAAPLPAQSPGAFEVVPFARYSWFDDALNLDDKFGGGGILGIYIARNLALEAEGAYTPTNNALGQDVSNIPLRGRLTYHIPLGGYASAVRLGAGYVFNMYREDVSFDDHGVTGVAGLRVGLSERFALQADGTLDFAPSPDGDRVDDYMNWGVQAGIALLFGNSYDRDKDEVKDKSDRCPATPAGESVDGNGCSASQRDADVDRVSDGADRCPNTPRGESVDVQGCAPSQKDADADAVVNVGDRCPDTPAKATVDQAGCSASQRDADVDRVSDSADRCPATPTGEAVDADGCAASQRDRDADGVRDNADTCPDTPAGTSVDARGCPSDSDTDGVVDASDKCPNTPTGQTVDASGCPVLPAVTFALGKAGLTKASQATLQDVARSLAAMPDHRVEVSGHTDSTGGRQVNLRLSQRRAQAVADFLAKHGVLPAQVSVQGHGADKPIAPNGTAEGRAQNRRVDFTWVH